MTLQMGNTPEKGDLLLATGGDFVWTWRNDEGNFPSGATLVLHIGEVGETITQWPFVISGDTASINVDFAVADLIEDRTPWRLIYTEGVAPKVETVVAYGIVKRVV